jgi:hypothetical protein
MAQLDKITVIHIVWEGPFSIDAALKRRLQNDYGLYQIYGTHPIYGENALLRIGQANARTFHGRLPWYQSHWEQLAPDHYDVYLGRLGGWEPVDDIRWGVLIDNAEAIAIFTVSPPSNSPRLISMNVKEPTIALNYGRRHRLPKYLSNLDELVDLHDGVFKLYGPPHVRFRRQKQLKKNCRRQSRIVTTLWCRELSACEREKDVVPDVDADTVRGGLAVTILAFAWGGTEEMVAG